MDVTSPRREELLNQALLTHWYENRASGRRLLQQLTSALEKDLDQAFGYHMLVTGADMGLEFSRLGKTQRVFRLIDRATNSHGNDLVRGVSSELPFASDSLDVVVLCHTPDTSPLPHQVLRECQRVLVPNGHLFILGFNPVSLWGWGNQMRAILSSRRRRLRAVGGRKLRDWLTLLGFSSSEPRYLSAVTPVGRGAVYRFLERLDSWLVRHNFGGGSVYTLHGRKRVSQYIDTLSRVESRPRLISIPLGKTQGGVPVPRRVSRAGSGPLEPQP